MMINKRVDVDSVMSDMSIVASANLVAEEMEKMQRIDLELQRLHDQDMRPATREELDKLILDCMVQMDTSVPPSRQ